MKVKRGTLVLVGLTVVLTLAWALAYGQGTDLGDAVPEQQPSAIDVDVMRLLNNELEQRREVVAELVEMENKQLDCMITAVFFEARGEPALGKRWVYHVINNRSQMGYRGKTDWCSTIFDPYQFSFANDDPGVKPDFTKMTADLEETVSEVENMFYSGYGHYDITGCSTHYLRTDWISKVAWARQAEQGRSPEGLVRKGVIGSHTFYGPANCN